MIPWAETDVMEMSISLGTLLITLGLVGAFIASHLTALWYVMRMVKSYSSLEAKVDLLLTNHLPHINNEIVAIKDDLKQLREELVRLILEHR
jgi:hypothetical protein